MSKVLLGHFSNSL